MNKIVKFGNEFTGIDNRFSIILAAIHSMVYSREKWEVFTS